MTCPVCSAPTRAFVDEEGIEYRRCPVCALVHKAPHHHPDWAAQKARYDLHNNREDDPDYRAYFARFLDWVLEYIQARGRALSQSASSRRGGIYFCPFGRDDVIMHLGDGGRIDHCDVWGADMKSAPTKIID